MFLHRRADILKKRGGNSEGYPEFHKLPCFIVIVIDANLSRVERTQKNITQHQLAQMNIANIQSGLDRS
jgi:hypothetical protein